MSLDFDGIRRNLPPLHVIIEDAGVRLRKQGTRYFGHCPFHEDHSPSFSVFPDGLRCGCPPCQWDGDVFEFTQRFHDLPDAAAAARWLCEQYDLPILEASPVTTPRPTTRRPVRRTATPAEPKRKTKRGREIEHYDYTDPEWNPAFRVFRFEALWEDTGELALNDDGKPKKDFGQRRFLPDGSLARGMDGVTYWLYRMPAIVDATTVWLCEGERDVHALEACGVIATTDPGGCGAARHFAERGYPAMLAGKDVLIVPDTDQVGRERGAAPLPAAADSDVVREWLERRGIVAGRIPPGEYAFEVETEVFFEVLAIRQGIALVRGADSRHPLCCYGEPVVVEAGKLSGSMVRRIGSGQ